MVTGQVGPEGTAIVVLEVPFELTHAEISGLPTNPVELITAPGTGKAIIVLAWAFKSDTTAGAYSGASNAAWQLLANGATAGLTAVAPASFIQAAQVVTRSICGSEMFVGTGTFDGAVVADANNIIEDASVSLVDPWNGTDYADGHADNTIRGIVLYAIVDWS